MKTHIVIDGNAFYEVDEECLNQYQKGKTDDRKKQKEADDIDNRKQNQRNENSCL